jgi:uncharacterized LabA/DUF88 family protein
MDFEPINKGENMSRTLLVIDGANFYYMQQHQGWEVDVEKFKNAIESKCNLTDARYYLSLPVDPEKRERQERFKHILPKLGFKVISQDNKLVKTEDGDVEKGNIDMLLALEVLRDKNMFDTLILVSGDGDFCCLIEMLRNSGKRIKVISHKSMVSRDILAMLGNDFHDMDDFRELIERVEEINS